MNEPHDVAAERQALGAVLVKGEPALRELRQAGLSTGDFYRHGHSAIWAAALRLADEGTPITSISVADALRDDGNLGVAGGQQAIYALGSDLITAAGASHYAEIVVRKARQRQRLRLLSEGVRHESNGGLSGDELAELTERLRALSDPRTAPGVDRLMDRLDLAGILDAPPPPISWAWDGYLEQGTLALLHGAGGLGKSLLALGLARSMTGSRTFLDRPTTEGRVLVVDGENAESEIRRRLHGFQFRAVVDRLSYLRAVQAWLQRDDAMTWLESGIRDSAATLVILDSQRALWSGDEKEAADVRPLFRALAQVAEKTGACILLIHHDNRRGDYSGTTDLNAGVGSRLHLRSVADSPHDRRVELVHAKMRSAPERAPIAFTIGWEASERAYTFTITAGSEASDNDVVQAAANFVHARGRVTTKQLADAVERDVRTVRRWVEDGGLGRLGVRSNGKGQHWVDTPGHWSDTDKSDTPPCPTPLPLNQAENPPDIGHAWTSSHVRASDRMVEPNPGRADTPPPTGATECPPPLGASGEVEEVVE